MKKFRVTFLPFPTSDLTSECELYATDEQDARRVFEAKNEYSSATFKSAEEVAQ